MNSVETLTTFFGWCTVLNLGFLVFVALIIMVMRGTMTRVHSAIFGVNEAELPGIYFRYLAHYQTLTLFLALIPYVSLKLMQ